MTLDVNTTLKKKYAFLPTKKKLLEIKERILGKNYDLSLVFVGDKMSKKLNTEYRQKEHKANVLSFPLNSRCGEIFINIPNSERECKKWDKTPKKFVEFLFIHGCAHLKGYDHINEEDAKKMERYEKKIRKEFGV